MRESRWGRADAAEVAVWHASRYGGYTGAYHVQVLFDVEGKLTLARLRALVARACTVHPASRSAYREIDGELFVRRGAAQARPRVTLVGLAGEDAAARCRDLVPTFDLAAGECLEVFALGSAQDVRHVYAVFHHIAFDAQAAQALLAAMAGPEVRPVAGPARAGAGPEQVRAAQTYWQSRAGWLGHRDIGLGVGARGEPGPTRTVDVPGGEEFVRALDVLAGAEGCSALAALGGVVGLWAARATGARTLALGAPFDTRRVADLGSVGSFADVLPVPLTLRADATTHEAVRVFAASLLEVARYRHVPFARVAPASVSDPQEPFAYYVNVVELADVVLGDGLMLRAQVPPFLEARYGISVYVLRAPSAARALVAYDEDAVDGAWARTVAHNLARVVGLCGADEGDPCGPKGSLPVAPLARFAPSGGEAPGRTAIRDGGAASYDDLIRTALPRSTPGGSPWHNVALVGGPGLPLARAMVATCRDGRRFTLLDEQLPPGELHRRALAAGCDAWWCADDGPDGWDASQRLRLEETSAPWPTEREDFGYVAFTSGSTGEAVAVEGTEDDLRAAFGWYAARLDLGGDDVVGVFSAVGHDPFLRDTLLPLWLGGRVEFPPRDDGELAGWFAEAGATVVHLTPTRAGLLLVALQDCGVTSLPSLRHVVLGGEPLVDDLARRLARLAPRARVHNAYGTTETPQVQTLFTWAPQARPSRWLHGGVPLGAGGGLSALRVVDADGRECWTGEPGQIEILTPVVATPVGAAAVGGRPAVVRTGDLGVRGPGGNVLHRGRIDDLLSVGGELVVPLAVEQVLGKVEGVHDCAVLLDPGITASPVLTALVVPEPGARPDVAALASAALAQLPQSHVPRRYLRLPALPRLANGKIDRRALPEASRAAAELQPSVDGAVGAVERKLASVVGPLLGAEQLDRTVRWSWIGADSLRLARIAVQLSSCFVERGGDRVRYSTVRVHDTLAGLAPLLEERPSGASATQRRALRAPGTSLGDLESELWAESVLGAERGLENFVFVAYRLIGAVPDVHLVVRVLDQVLRECSLAGVGVDPGDGTGRPTWRTAASWQVELVDLQAAAGTPGEALPAAVHEVERRPLPGAGGELLVAQVVVDRDEVAVCLKADHAVCDGLSIELVVERFLGRLAGTDGDATRRGDPVTALQHASDRAAVLAPAWAEALVAADPRRRFDRPWHADAHRAPARRARRDWAGPELVAFRERCASLGVSEFVGLLACVAFVVSRHTGGGPAVTVHVPVSTRAAGEAEAIGSFVRAVPVAVPVPDGATFAASCARAGEALALAMDHAQVPSADVGRALGDAVETSSGDPVCLLAHQVDDAHRRPGVEAVRLDDARPRALAALNLRVDSRADGMTFVADNLRRLLDDRHADRVLDHLQSVLRAMAGGSTQPLDGVHAADPAERARVRAAVLEARADGPGLPVASAFAERVLRHPGCVAMETDTASLTYRELGSLVGHVLDRMAELGAGGRDVVGVELPRGPVSVAVVQALLMEGAVYLPVQPDLPLERRDDMLRRGGATFAMTAPGRRLPDGVRRLDLDVREDAATDAELRRWFAGRALRPADREAYRIFTSGSTGTPKCVSIGLHSLERHLAWMQKEFDLGPDDTVLVKTPVGFDPSVWELTWPLASGARVAVAPEGAHLDPQRLLDFAAAHRVSVMHAVPSLLEITLDVADLSRCRGLRLVIVSGEALASSTAARFRDRSRAQLVNLYGPTEATIDVTSHDVTGDEGGPVPIGRAVGGTYVLVLDDRLRPVPLGCRGEIVVGGVQVGRGYHGDPVTTASRFPTLEVQGCRERVYRTGDIGYVDRHGDLIFVGRRDRQVKIAGARTELGEVESALSRDPRVRAARAALVGTRLCALVTLVPGADGVDPGDLERGAAAVLPRAAVPRVTIVPEMPLLPNGKTDFSQVRPGPRADGPAVPRPDGETPGSVAHPDEVQALLADTWSAVLGVPVQVQDHFFRLGGNSMDAIRVVARLRARGYVLEAADVLGHPDLPHLAAILRRQPVPDRPDAPDPTDTGAGDAFSLLSGADAALLRGIRGTGVARA